MMPVLANRLVDRAKGFAYPALYERYIVTVDKLIAHRLIQNVLRPFIFGIQYRSRRMFVEPVNEILRTRSSWMLRSRSR